MADEKNTNTPEGCTHDCSTCGSNCSSRTAPNSFLAEMNAGSNVKHVIAVVSGKGGVGKSLVTSLLTAGMQKKGYSTAVLDADITGPSIPKAFGILGLATSDGQYIYPRESANGTKIMSMNLLLENPEDPVVWRSGIITGAVKQFWTDVLWEDVDYMFVDMPPGTGDVPLTVFQSLPIDGIIIVTSPQELVSMIVTKAVKMAELMNVPVLGIVENMSYFMCPNCNEKHRIYGDGHVKEIAKNYNIEAVCEMPIDPNIAAFTDKGMIESYDTDALNDVLTLLENIDNQ